MFEFEHFTRFTRQLTTCMASVLLTSMVLPYESKADKALTEIWEPWFGMFLYEQVSPETGSGWAYHEEHQWMFVAAATETSFWSWSDPMGWLWTSAAGYPYLYSSDRGSWIWYHRGTTEPRWFVDSLAPEQSFPDAYSWNTPQAAVLPDGNLGWAPQRFSFEKGASVRYIDYENGDNSRDGKSRETAWKQHPWDRAATGEARNARGGIHTYVFKGGVIYRVFDHRRGGGLIATESGTEENPIRLTSDPSWGDGRPVLYGSRRIQGEWHRASAEEAPGVPAPENVWYIDLGMDFDPGPTAAKFSAMWQIDGENVERLHIARTPNYDFSDPNNPLKNWPTWDRIDAGSNTFHSTVIRELEGADTEALRDAIVWSTNPTLMGSATPRDMSEAVWDTSAGTVTTTAFGSAEVYATHRRWNHFMIENVAQLLDSPGEFFFQRRGSNAGRLYLWPAGNVDPNTVDYEVPVKRNLISIEDQSNIVISGLEFRYNDPNDGSSVDNTRHNTRPSHCVLIVGNCSNISVRNNAFYYVADAIEARLNRVHEGGSKGQVMDQIIISDNDIRDASGAGIVSILADYHRIHPAETEYGYLRHVEVMRNRLINTGFRGARARWDSLPAISVRYPETCEIAGNIIDTSFGIGIITYGGKASGHQNRKVPLARYLVHHNQLDNTLLGVNDYGGLEHFQGGPTYIYNNVSRNAVGNRSFWNRQLGYNLYLDGGFKCYSFNNILAGDVRPDDPDYYSNVGYFMVFGFLNQFFNNTIYRFEHGIRGSSGNRSNVLGNVLMDLSKSFMTQNRPGDHSMLGGGDTGEMGRMGIPTMAYSSNVFHGSPEKFGEVAGISEPGQPVPVVSGATLEELRDELEAQQSRLSDLGWHVDEAPLTNPTNKDYRPTSGYEVEERGVDYFVPWALARTVGEWNFYKHHASPEVISGENFYMTEEYIRRGQYYFLPRNDLIVSDPVSAEDYVYGPLENWIEGALSFDGTRVAVLSHAEMSRDMTYPGQDGSPPIQFDGSKRETLDMATNSFIIEMVFRTEEEHTGGTLVSKITSSAGYELSLGPDGALRLTIRSNGTDVSVDASAKVNDGQWHHVLVEVDRAAGVITFYVGGRVAGRSQIANMDEGASLANTGDFVVGNGLVGAVDFVRVTRSTLAESRTTIDELFTWQFDGPFLRDIAGNAPASGRSRDAGALQR